MSETDPHRHVGETGPISVIRALHAGQSFLSICMSAMI